MSSSSADALIAALQGASNAAASNVSGPVDLLAWLLRKGGVPVPSNAFGGSEWMRQQGLTAEPKNKLAGMLGEGVGLAAPFAIAAKAPQIAGAMNKADDALTAGANRMADHFERTGANFRGPPNQRGAIVYHGSPHKFDKFDSSKIGTGEGAQAYGHGLYLAESPDTAKFYQGALTDRFPAKLDGKPMAELSTAQKSALGILNDYGGNVDGALAFAKRDMQKAGSAGADFHVERYNTLVDIKRGKSAAEVASPSLYKVDLPDEKIARMLDWDKPLQKQAPQVQQAIKARLKDLGYSPSAAGLRAYHIEHGGFADATGETLAKKFFGDTPEAGAAFMRQQGIPGIRYLDGGSRGAGAGTSNYVVFPGEEAALNILERNGSPINALVQALKGPR